MTEQKKHLVLVGAYATIEEPGILVFEFETVNKKLKAINQLTGIANPSFMLPHPIKDCFYAVSEIENGSVVTVTLSSDGKEMNILNQRPTQGGSPCHLVIDQSGRWLVASNYMGGNAICFPIREDGRLGPESCLVEHEGSSINKDRQEGPHAHSAIFTPDNKFLLVADLGIDRLIVYRFDETSGHLERHSEIVSTQGSGPRHCAFHQKKPYLYVVHELNNMVAVYLYNAESAEFVHQQTVSSLLAENKDSYIADVHVDNAGKWLYVSNRGDDSITVFDIEQDGRLTTQKLIPCGGAWPRNFALAPDQHHILVANQNSNELSIVDISSGESVTSAQINQASCVQIVS